MVPWSQLSSTTGCELCPFVGRDCPLEDAERPFVDTLCPLVGTAWAAEATAVVLLRTWALATFLGWTGVT